MLLKIVNNLNVAYDILLLAVYDCVPTRLLTINHHNIIRKNVLPTNNNIIGD